MKRLIHILIALFLLYPSLSFASENAAKGSIGDSNKLPPMTNEMLSEAIEISDDCKANKNTDTYYECDCVGLTYLELRRKKGTEESSFWIREEALRKCPNRPAIAGKIYNECVGWAAIQRGEDYETFCACYGSNYAKIFGQNPTDNILVIEAQMIAAMQRCDPNRENERLKDRDTFVRQLKENGTYDSLFPGAKKD
jgi:hypothetical protein